MRSASSCYHAGTVIVEPQADEMAGAAGAYFAGDIHVGGFEADFAALRQRPARVGDEIDQHVAELIGIGAHFAEFSASEARDRDFRPRRGLQVAGGIVDHAVEIDHGGEQNFTSAEQPELIGDSGGHIAGALDRFGGGAGGVAGRQRGAGVHRCGRGSG